MRTQATADQHVKVEPGQAHEGHDPLQVYGALWGIVQAIVEIFDAPPQPRPRVRPRREISPWVVEAALYSQSALALHSLVGGLRKASLDSLGDVKPVGEGVFETREHFGPGWCMYYVRRGEVIVVMVGGGDRSTRTDDIAKAIRLVSILEE